VSKKKIEKHKTRHASWAIKPFFSSEFSLSKARLAVIQDPNLHARNL
jgi:hypothetical protein